MGWSKSTRIKVMIGIDTAFFLLELVTGFLAHSLALTADAFHMLNDIISLVIGLWAVVAAQKATTDEFTFGWVRAEILGAFFNAVFLIALCVSIILEAITRLIEPPEISNPMLILIVGCAGLFSNLVGFFVLGGHGHSHGPESHSHAHDHDHGHEHVHDHSHARAHDVEAARGGDGLTERAANENGRVGDVLPEALVQRASQPSIESPDQARRIRFGETPLSREQSFSKSGRGRDRRRSSKSGHSRLISIDDMSIHPASFRQDIIIASQGNPQEHESTSESDPDEASTAVPSQQGSTREATETSPLLKSGHKGSGNGNGTMSGAHKDSSPSRKMRSRRDSSVHTGHHHTLPKQPSKSGGHGHNHGDMGMNAMILHVIGDALGNLGVIITALIIWKTNWPGKLYADPAVSLFITAIILNTSIPLTRATARILLQATPDHISIKEIRQDIERLPGVVSCHHIHVWQLSDTKVVASLHLQVSFPINSHSGEKYMQLAKRARGCLHGFGIHSATIQPEFCLDSAHRHDLDGPASSMDGTLEGSQQDACLLACVDECAAQGCCTGLESTSVGSSVRRHSDSTPSDAGSHHHH